MAAEIKKIKFRPADRAFYRVLKGRVNAHFDETGRSRSADWRLWAKGAVFAVTAAGCYAAILWEGTSGWQKLALANLCGLSVLLLAINVAHDAAHDALTRKAWLNRAVQTIIFMLLGADAYLWRLRHVKSHHTFPNVNGCDIDIDNTTFLRLSPNHPCRPYHRFQHLYAPAIFWLADVHTVFWQDFVYLRKDRLANMVDIRHPRHAYFLFFGGKLAYLAVAVVIPILVLPFAWWQVAGGVLLMTFVNSTVFVLLLIGTHFAEEADFPEFDADGYISHDWAVHALVTSVDWSPTSFWATLLAGGANAHAAHHLFPTIAHTHYAALTPIIARTAAEFGIPYHRTTLWRLIASHFRFLKRMGRPPAELQGSGRRPEPAWPLPAAEERLGGSTVPCADSAA
jgi:linoleoyl-CoA desaturase